ncbi:hypothetical protein JCM6882_004362 [Rhodosporidiobolus microsporus]
MANKELETAVAVIQEGEGSAAGHLAELGYAPQLQRTRGQLGIQCLLISLFALPFGYVTGFSTGLIGGGAVSLLWGFILVGFMQECVAISLGELASAFPTAAGPYYWVYQLAPSSIRVPLSYATGVVYTLCLWMLNLGTHMATTTGIISCIYIYKPDYEAPAWLSVGNKGFAVLDMINSAVTAATIVIISATLLATHKSGFNSASFVFGSYLTEYSGWGQGWTFFIGLLPGCLVSCAIGMVTSMSEEVQHPEIQIPRAMVIGIPAATISGVILAISMLFTMPPPEDLLNAPGGLPVPYFFKTVLYLLLLSAGLMACTANQFVSSRATWAFARDGAVPFSRLIAQVDGRAQPRNALLASTFSQMGFALITLGSTAALNAFFGVGIIGAEVAYGIPIGLNLLTHRRAVEGARFHAGKMGWVVNSISLVWMCLCLVIFCMPVQLPVTLLTMNWASVVLLGCLALSAVWYLFVARHIYRGPPASAALHHQKTQQGAAFSATSDDKLPVGQV